MDTVLSTRNRIIPELSTNVIIIMQTALRFTLEATLQTVTVSDLQNPAEPKNQKNSL